MRIYLLLIAALTILVPGCDESATLDRSGPEQEEVGTLQLALRGVDAEMQTYRLRNATFNVSGTRYTDFQSVSTTLSSETNLESPTLRAQLFYGDYSVGLQTDGWYLERVTEAGTERVERAVLVSQPQQHVFVSQGQISQVAFQFGVDGEPIDFFGGQIEIAIGIQHAPDAGTQPQVP